MNNSLFISVKRASLEKERFSWGPIHGDFLMEIFIIHVAVVVCCLSEGHSSGKNSVLCIFTKLLHLSRNSGCLSTR